MSPERKYGAESEQHEHVDPDEIRVVEESFGTIVVPKDETDPRRLLRPEPSLDPNDPLNWPSWQKYLTYGTICFYSFLSTVNASNFSVAVIQLDGYFHTSNARTSFLICFNTLMLGVGNLFWIPLMRVIGKRPVYLVAMLLLTAFNFWSFKATSFGSLLAARILSGFAAAAGDSPTPSAAADLFFVHERGFVMMIFQIALSCGFFIGPLINAYLVQNTGSWQWNCGWIGIAAGANFLVAIFTVHETAYVSRDVNAPAESFGPKRSFLSSMSLTKGYNKNASFFTSLYNIFSVAIYPPVIWAGTITGVFVSWNIVVQLESSVLFVAPPYRWKTSNLGNLALSGLIGTFIAIFIGGKLIDMIANRMTKIKGGRREPEYRLPTLVIPSIVGPMGLLIFGLCSAHKTNWVGPAFGYGMQGFGLSVISNILVTYVVDSYHSLAGEAVVFFFVIRSVIACMLSLFAFDWIEAAGVANAFGQMVAIEYFLLLFAIGFYFKGKEIRRWTATYGPLKKQNAVLVSTRNEKGTV
ncbi:major facilitator superfamily domain-containing protein [Xylogone sp. PMI_703]|nr:major facilitator superfamily domain-containing protein [Xylogone sp. PMI_703]